MRILAALALAALAACGTSPDVTRGAVCEGFEAGRVIDIQRATGRAAQDDFVAELADDLARAARAARRGDAGPGAMSVARGRLQLDVLAITTGGQNGAFGAGVLAGWSDRPEFGVVTGASAGAVIAPVAFAGRGFDDRLALFSGVGDADLVRRRPFFGLFSDAVYSTDPLAARVRAAYTPDLIEAIAARSDANAMLYIGATGLRSGRFERFDIHEMIRRTPDVERRRDCLTAAALASAAIPGVFPPQDINGQPYSDAGVRQHVFLEGVGDAVALAERETGTPIAVHVTLLINDDLTFDGVERVERTLLPLALRNIALVTDEGMRASLRRALRYAGDRGWRLRAMAIPADFAPDGCAPEASSVFTPCYTAALFARGREMGAAGTDWMNADDLRGRVASGAAGPPRGADLGEVSLR